MATVASSAKGLVVTSGLRFCLLNKSSDPNLRYDVENNTIQSIPDPLPRQDVSEVPQPPKENLRILCCAISQNSEFVAFADDHKQVTVWSWKDGNQLNLVRQWNMFRRANKIIFDKDATSILIADKSGDVFQFVIESEEKEGKCILGHLSMLLDIRLSKCGKFIITCDRDEKIRVSHFPNAYNIHNFCLGHSDFVTCLDMFNGGSLMVSGSGDGTLKVWDFLKGKVVSSVICAQDAKLEELDIDVDTNKEQHQFKRTTSWPSILGVRIAPEAANTKNTLITVSLEKFNGILVYAYCDNELTYLKKILSSGPLWDHQFINATEVALLQAKENENIDIVNIEENKHELVKTHADFFKDAMETPDSASLFVEELHKRWFDNVKEYLDKKRERVDNSEKAKKKMKC